MVLLNDEGVSPTREKHVIVPPKAVLKKNKQMWRWTLTEKKNTWHLAMTRSITHGDDQSQFHLRKTTTGKFGERRITLPSWQKYFPVYYNYSSCPPIRTFQWVNYVISLMRETHPIMTIISQHLPNLGILLDTPNKKNRPLALENE